MILNTAKTVGIYLIIIKKILYKFLLRRLTLDIKHEHKTFIIYYLRENTPTPTSGLGLPPL